MSIFEIIATIYIATGLLSVGMFIRREVKMNNSITVGDILCIWFVSTILCPVFLPMCLYFLISSLPIWEAKIYDPHKSKPTK
jgi:hypothetical protein